MDSDNNKPMAAPASAIDKFAQTFQKVAENNKAMLQQVDWQIRQLKTFMEKLEEGRDEITAAEVKIARLAHKLNNSYRCVMQQVIAN